MINAREKDEDDFDDHHDTEPKARRAVSFCSAPS